MLTSVGVPGAPSGKQPVTGSLTTAGMGDAFEPVTGRPFYVSAWKDGSESGECFHLCRSFDGGDTWLVVIDEGLPEIQVGTSKSYTSYEHGVVYAVKRLSSTGTIYYRISQ
ncbi:hypothetical protein [Xanthobacter wiegelii]|uniref:hypothetical protein n=1 Tax=Xanthobacter wiegelii TaxID=3119913 RepID=UPI00372B78B7